MVEKLNLEEKNKEETPAKSSVSGTDKEKTTFWNKIFNKNKVSKTDVVFVIFLRNNGSADLMYLKPKDGQFDINGRIYHQRVDCNYTIGAERIPCAIIPEWSMVPFGKKEYFEFTAEKRIAELQDHCIKAIRTAEIVKLEGGEKKAMQPKTVIALIILAVVGYAFYKGFAG